MTMPVIPEALFEFIDANSPKVIFVIQFKASFGTHSLYLRCFAF
jgi:hypothetical protein